MFKTEKSLKLHRKVHSVQKHLQCEQCEKRFKSQNGLKLYLQLHKGSGEIHKKYTCLQCGKTFGYLSNFRRHSNVHSEARPFHCSLCDKRFNIDLIFTCDATPERGRSPARVPALSVTNPSTLRQR